MNIDVMFSSKTDEWATPQDLFVKLDRVFSFTTDVCAVPENAKCANFYTPQQDGLAQDWRGSCRMNPPYGRQIAEWVQKAFESSINNNATVVCLLPARTDTRWWQQYCLRGETYFIPGRLKFGGSKNSAPFPSALVVFRPSTRYALERGE